MAPRIRSIIVVASRQVVTSDRTIMVNRIVILIVAPHLPNQDSRMSTYRLDRLVVAAFARGHRCQSSREFGRPPHDQQISSAGGFDGPFAVVNPHYGEIEGISTSHPWQPAPRCRILPSLPSRPRRYRRRLRRQAVRGRRRPSSSRPGSATAPDHWPRRPSAQRKRRGCGWSVPIASACWCHPRN